MALKNIKRHFMLKHLSIDTLLTNKLYKTTFNARFD